MTLVDNTSIVAFISCVQKDTFMFSRKIIDTFEAFGVESLSFEEIIDMLKNADEMYFNEAESFLSDEQYDSVKRYAETLQPSHPYFAKVGSEVRGSKVKLPFSMGSLTQAYEGDIEKWIKKYNLYSQNLFVTEKLDGVSVLLVYGEGGQFKIAYSRGDGIEGADITRHLMKIKQVPMRVVEKEPMVIRAEAIISKENFAKIQPLVKNRAGQPYKNPRNMMAGVMNAETNPDIIYQYIDIIAYEVVVSGHNFNKRETLYSLHEKNDFKIPQSKLIYGRDVNDGSLTEILNEFRATTSYEIDGVVIEVNDIDLRNKIVPTKDTLNPEYARKFKIADANNYAETEVIEVQWSVSKDGYLKPRLKVNPIKLLGVEINYCTAFNAKFIVENNIGPGAIVGIVRSGDVIPLITKVIKSMPIS